MVIKRRNKKCTSVVANTNGECSKDTNAKKEMMKEEENERLKKDTKSAIDAKVDPMKQGYSLVPMGLILTVFLCSGPLWLSSFRDFTATGKVLFDSDLAMLQFTKSREWFDDSNGWKSTQGGFSAVQSISTDANNMGGFFVRKVAGSASLTFYTQKLVPILFFSSHNHQQRKDSYSWKAGHFVPLLVSSIVGNIAICIFYFSYLQHLQSFDANAHLHACGIILLLSLETLVIISYLIPLLLAFRRKRGLKLKPNDKIQNNETSLTSHKSHREIVSKIMMRTILIVSSLITVIAGRDLLFPGQEIDIIPRDDIYLEWTNAFFHSPPPFTQEGDEYGLEAPLYIGDRFISQLGALYLLLNCILFKFPTAVILRVGKDRSGETKCRMFWKVQAIGNAMLTFTLRIFANASVSASLDLRWHLMCLGYETFMLFLYGYV